LQEGKANDNRVTLRWLYGYAPSFWHGLHGGNKVNDAQKFLLDHGLDDKWVGIPKFSNAVAVDAKGVYVSDLMEYWRKQGVKNTEQLLQPKQKKGK
jgi:hypothetical protein